MTTSVVVDKIPNCDFCKEPTPAYADGQTMMGPWANMCKPCFDMYGVGMGTVYHILFPSLRNGGSNNECQDKR